MIVTVPIVSLAVAVMLLFRYRRGQVEMVHLIRRLRDTAMYRQLYPMLMNCAARGLEEVYVSPAGVRFRTIARSHMPQMFLFAREGFDDLTEDTMAVLVQALALDAGCLSHRDLYQLDQGEEVFGEVRFSWYAYQLHPECKDRCLSYYRIKEQHTRIRMSERGF